MEKKEMVQNSDEIKNIVNGIVISAGKTVDEFKKNLTAESFLFEGKFNNLGFKWDGSGTQYDLGEQIQQGMTMLVTCYAIKWFSENGYDYPFTVNPAGKCGQDISGNGKEGPNGKEPMTCEIFAAKKSTNNQKLWHDLNAVAIKGGLSKELKTFVFCCSADEIQIKEGRHSSTKSQFDFTVDEVIKVDNPNCHIFQVKISDQSAKGKKEKKYENQLITVIHVTPCVLHQWVRKNIAPSDL